METFPECVDIEGEYYLDFPRIEEKRGVKNRTILLISKDQEVFDYFVKNFSLYCCIKSTNIGTAIERELAIEQMRAWRDPAVDLIVADPRTPGTLEFLLTYRANIIDNAKIYVIYEREADLRSRNSIFEEAEKEDKLWRKTKITSYLKKGTASFYNEFCLEASKKRVF